MNAARRAPRAWADFSLSALPRFRHFSAIKSPSTVTLADIRAAQRRIAGGVVVTPCPESVPLSEITDARIFCKLDNLQRTGSFKERGARNALLCLTAAQRRFGVIAASAATMRSGSPTTAASSACR